ncbi:d-alanyl-d-alanine carboxypeptidase family protein [Stylonychia lemnae]|uniref:D-alanyl-d-alanine carboxypeptidase family protein n=1 Tax=Stylonychia lemnae TaxID=5949 RepID=A0A077ZVE0_STYLE|nr:d-alanyl-d-alanine carboxypeptidase family protein [Stylonychia lemnae]|eukprot:CDW73870.1 d-alanyl-d-alanine carboxypeptidase family protein [Stylonychia lemnae]
MQEISESITKIIYKPPSQQLNSEEKVQTIKFDDGFEDKTKTENTIQLSHALLKSSNPDAQNLQNYYDQDLKIIDQEQTNLFQVLKTQIPHQELKIIKKNQVKMPAQNVTKKIQHQQINVNKQYSFSPPLHSNSNAFSQTQKSQTSKLQVNPQEIYYKVSSGNTNKTPPQPDSQKSKKIDNPLNSAPNCEPSEIYKAMPNSEKKSIRSIISSIQNSKQSNMKLFKDQIQFIQNHQPNMSRSSSNSSQLMKSLSVSSFHAALQIHQHHQSQAQDKSQINGPSSRGQNDKTEILKLQLKPHAQSSTDNTKYMPSEIYQNVSGRLINSPKKMHSQINCSSTLPPVNRKQIVTTSESSMSPLSKTKKISSPAFEQIKLNQMNNSSETREKQINASSIHKSFISQLSKRNSVNPHDSHSFKSNSPGLPSPMKQNTLTRLPMTNQTRHRPDHSSPSKILSSSFQIMNTSRIQQSKDEVNLFGAAEKLEIELIDNINENSKESLNKDSSSISFDKLTNNINDVNVLSFDNDSYKPKEQNTQLLKSQILNAQKRIPEDFTETLRQVTNNNHAQEFHRYCFQTLLKKKNRKIRNIYQQNIPVYQRQPSMSEKTFDTQSQSSKQSNNASKSKDLGSLYRSMIQDIKIFDPFEVDTIIDQAQQDQFPIVSAKAWAISETKKGVIMHGKDQTFQREMASLTKIMTAYTICRLLNELNINNPRNVYLRVSKKAAFMTGTTAFLKVDQRINVYDCLHALLLPSGNDAAIVLATAFGKWLYFANEKQKKQINGNPVPQVSELNQNQGVPLVSFEYGHDEYIQAFVQEMNKQAKKLKLDKPNFSNPHGLSEKANHASPSDICIITANAMKYDLFKEIVGRKQYECIVISKFGDPVNYQWTNSNKLLNSYFQGVKTGITPTAGPCLCCDFSYMDFSAIACIMDAKNVDIRWKEMATLMLWALDKHIKRAYMNNLFAPVNYINSGKKMIQK